MPRGLRIFGDEIWYDAVRVGWINVPPGTRRDEVVAAINGSKAWQDGYDTAIKERSEILDQEYQRGFNDGYDEADDQHEQEYWRGFEEGRAKGYEEGYHAAKEEPTE